MSREPSEFSALTILQRKITVMYPGVRLNETRRRLKRMIFGVLLLFLLAGFGYAVQHVSVGFEDPVQIIYGVNELGSGTEIIVYDKIVEDGETFYGITQKAGTNRLWISETEAYKGTRSLAATCYAVDVDHKDRAEFRSVQGVKDYALNFGQEMFYGYAMKIDTNSTNPTAGMHIMQGYQNNSESQIPLTLSYHAVPEPGIWLFNVYARTPTETHRIGSIRIPLGAWTKLVWRLRPAHPGMDDGLISLWVNDEQVFSWSGNWGHEPMDSTDQVLDLRCGVYRGPCDRLQTIYYDQIKYGDSYYEADPETEIEWSFRSDLEEWTVLSDIQNITVASNLMQGSIVGPDSRLLSPDELGMFCTDNPRVVLRIKNASAATNAALYFTTEPLVDDFNRTNTTQVAYTVNAGGSGWVQAGDGGATGNDWYIKDNALRLRNRSLNAILYNTNLTIPGGSNTSFILKADVMGLQHGTYAGIVFNYADEENYYLIRFRAGFATYQFLQQTASGWEVLLSENLPAGTFSEDVYYTVAVTSDSPGIFDFTIDETGVGTVVSTNVNDSVGTLTNGCGGFYGTLGSLTQLANFDNFELQLPGSLEFSQDKRVEPAFFIKNDQQHTLYEFDMASNPMWTGQLRQLRFDPVNQHAITTGVFSLDFIDLTALPAESVVDSDLDGFTNQQEAIAGTDWYDAQSRFVVEPIRFSSSGAELVFYSTANRRYDVYGTTNLSEGIWSPLRSFYSASRMFQTVSVPDDHFGFFRVGVSAP